jgi:processive 1,2-diacylglycerol beta-glucosyltransferase
MDVIFLSVSIGSGHHKAAQALEEAIRKKYPKSRTMIVDTLKYINPFLDKWIVKGYFSSLKASPLIFKKIYEMTDEDGDTIDISKNLNRILSFKIKKLIRNFKPQAMVCTHPFGLQILHSLKKRGKIHFPVVAIVTDYSAHKFWIEHNIDAYIVGTKSIQQYMVTKGIPFDRIHPIGIPVLQSFTIENNKEQIRRDFKLTSKKTALVMGGSLGLGEVLNIVKRMLLLKEDIQLIIVTGHNENLRKEVLKETEHSSKDVLVLGYTEKIAELMDVSDFILTKPGGMTVAESMVKKLPIFVTSPIPGHEEKNAKFIVNHGLGVWVFKEQDLEDLILSNIFQCPLRFHQMQQMTEFFSRPRAANDTVELLDQLIKESEDAKSGKIQIGPNTNDGTG